MSLGIYGSTLNDELNRLANGGTYPDYADYKDQAGAAQAWAAAESVSLGSVTDLVGVLNYINGETDRSKFLDLAGVCNAIAGTTGLEPAAALRQVSGTPPVVYNLGDTGPAGGIIFIVPASQGGLGGSLYYEGWQTDLGATAWSSNTSTLVGASGSAIGTGKTNTTLIPGGASALCQATRGGFSDWFFPSTDEMTQLFAWVSTTGSQNYWTSTESNASQAIVRDLAVYGRDPYPYSKGGTFNVRPVRSF